MDKVLTFCGKIIPFRNDKRSESIVLDIKTERFL